jgi:hypothetical protein
MHRPLNGTIIFVEKIIRNIEKWFKLPLANRNLTTGILWCKLKLRGKFD